MRPDRRFGVGRAWLVLVASASMAFGQGWEAEPVDPKGHTSDVVAVALVGKSLATAGSDGVAKVWDLVDPAQLTIRLADRVDLIGHDGKVLAVALSPDGKLVATGGADRTVRLWDSARGTPLATLKGHSGAVESLAFSPDGKTLASGALDTSIKLWDVGAKQPIRTIQGHEQGVRGVAFSPDGKLLASASRDHSIRLWNLPDGTERATLGTHDGPAWCVAFAPDGETVASGGLDKAVRLWKVGEPAQAGSKGAEPAQGKIQPPTRTPLPRQGRVAVERAFLVQPLPPQLPGGGIAVDEQVFDAILAQPQPNQLQAWPTGADVASVAFTPDGHYVAAASNLSGSRPSPGSVAFFAMPPREPGQPRPPGFARAPIRGHFGPILGLAFSPDGSKVATVGGDASVRLWNAVNATPLAASIGPSRAEAIEARVMAHLDQVEALAITPDGTQVATASGSSGVSLWDAMSRTLIGRLRFPDPPARSLTIAPDGRVVAVGEPFAPARALAISPDGKTLATGGDGRDVSLWELATARPLATLRGHLGAITSLAFSPDGKSLASGSKDASVTLWDVAKGVEIATLARHTSTVTGLAFGPDGSMLATGSTDGTVKLWELPSGRFLDTLAGHKDVVQALAFGDSGKTLASADRSGPVRFWDVASRAEREAPRSPSSPLRALAFGPDGRTLVGGGDDGWIRRWDLADGQVVAIRRDAHAGPILALAFGPGGKTLATGGADRELKLWDVDARLAPGRFADLEGEVRQIAVSPDGKTLATASIDQFVRVWDLATGRERIAPIAFETAQARLAFSPDSKGLAVLPVDAPLDRAKVWDVETGRPKAQGVANAQDGAAVAFAPDGKTWATAASGFVFFWDAAKGRPTRGNPAFLQANTPIRSLAFAPDGKTVSAGLVAGAVTSWDLAHPENEPSVFQATNWATDVLAYSPDGRSIAIGGSSALGGPERIVRVLDARTGAVRLTLRGHRRAITSLAFSPDGKLLASAAEGDSSAFVWDTTTGEVASNPTLPDASGLEGLACLAFSTDGKSLFAGGDRGVMTFDMVEGRRPPSRTALAKAGQERATLRGHAAIVRSVAFAGGGSTLVSRDDDGVVKVWDLGQGRERQTFGGSTDFKAQSIALRPDGKALAVGLRLPERRLRAPEPGDPPPLASPSPSPVPPPSWPRQRMSDEVAVWDLETGEGRGMINSKATTGGVDRVAALAYSPDGRTLATTSLKGILRTWDADSLDLGVDLDGRRLLPSIVLFSPDGKTLLGADASGFVTLWDLETGKIRASLAHDGGINQVLMSPDGKLIATAGGNIAAGKMGGVMDGAAPDTSTPLGPGSGGDVRLWDLATGRRAAVLPMESGKVTRLAFSPDGRTLVASTTAARATIWDVDSARPLLTLAWPAGEARHLAFSPDGQTLAIGGEDEVLRIWDIPAGTLRAHLHGHTDAIQWVAFSPDGKTLATASRDFTVKIWTTPFRRE